MCRRTRQIVAYYFGDRSHKTLKKLWDRIPEQYRKCRSFSDFYAAYAQVLSDITHTQVPKNSGETSRIERFNNILRQRIGRLVRKTLSFSKSEFFHDLSIKLFIIHYNLKRLLLINSYSYAQA